MATMYLIRGLPGSGKSSLAEQLTPGKVFSADQYPGLYVEGKLQPKLLELAHKDCQKRVWQATEWRREDVCVANTFSRMWELDPYLAMAHTRHYYAMVILAESTIAPSGHPTKSIHNVPQESIEWMKGRWEQFR